MTQKIIDSLNWLYIGIAGILFAVISWLSIKAAGVFAKKTVHLHWEDLINKISTEAAKKTAAEILVDVRESNKELFEIQKENIRSEVFLFLNPVKEGLEVLKNSQKRTENEIFEIKEEIAEIKKELEVSKVARHKTKDDVATVLHEVLDELKYLRKPAKQMKPKSKFSKLHKQPNSTYYE